MDEQEFKTRRNVAGVIGSMRSHSMYALNMSAAAKEAGITPSYLHRIENAEVLASADCYVRICDVYEIDPTQILVMIGRIGSEVTGMVLAFLAHGNLIEDLRTLLEGD